MKTVMGVLGDIKLSQFERLCMICMLISILFLGACNQTPEQKTFEKAVYNGKVPLSYEWLFTNEDGSLFRSPRMEITHVEISESRNNFDSICKQIKDEYHADVEINLIHGVPVVQPKDEKLLTDSNLSIPITLDMKNTSFCEIFVEINRQINCSLRYGGANTATFTSPARGNAFPPEILEPYITLNVDNVPAREALCLLLRETGLVGRFTYENSGSKQSGREFAYLYIDIFDRSGSRIEGKFKNRMSDEELEEYNQLLNRLNRKCEE